MNKCSQCDRTIASNKWARIKAHEEGWFTKNDETLYCPEHGPDWVPDWRKKNSERKDTR